MIAVVWIDKSYCVALCCVALCRSTSVFVLVYAVFYYVKRSYMSGAGCLADRRVLWIHDACLLCVLSDARCRLILLVSVVYPLHLCQHKG